MPSANWFLWSNPIRDFFFVSPLEGGNFVINFDNLVFFEGLWYFVFLFRFVCSKITGITRTDILSCLTMLDCIFVCNLNRCVRLVILNLFAVLWKEHRNISILDVTPFLEGWLIRPGKCVSIRLFRQTTVVYPHRQLFLCDEKILREMMLKLNDVCDCDEQFSWIVWVCVCFLGEKKKKWLLRPPSRCLLFRRLWFWCCLLLLLKQNLVLQLWFLLKTFSQIFDKVIKQWFRIVVGVCST